MLAGVPLSPINQSHQNIVQAGEVYIHVHVYQDAHILIYSIIFYIFVSTCLQRSYVTCQCLQRSYVTCQYLQTVLLTKVLCHLSVLTNSPMSVLTKVLCLTNSPMSVLTKVLCHLSVLTNSPMSVLTKVLCHLSVLTNSPMSLVNTDMSLVSTDKGPMSLVSAYN